MSLASRKLIQAAANAGAPSDDYWNSVQLLLNGDKGADGDNNTTFTGATITGSPDAANVNPYGAHYFDFTGGELDVLETGTEFTFGTGDFTVELWVNFDALSGLAVILDWRSAAGGSAGRGSLYTNGTSLIWLNGTVNVVSTTATTGQWYHVAVSRSGSTTKLFLDGVESGSATDSTNYIAPADNLHIGGLNGTYNINAKMSNLRIVKGTALYTAAFTPPTKTLTDVTGTSLLTFVNGAIVDYSSEAHDITTAAGAVRAYPGGPLNKPYDENAGSIVYPNDTSGSANYVDYSGAQTGMGTTFTIEFWYYPYTVNTTYADGSIACLLDAEASAGSSTADYWSVFQSSDDLRFYSGGGGGVTVEGSWLNVLKDLSWHHIMITGDGTNVELFVNGVSQGTSAFTYGTGTGTRKLRVGREDSAFSRYVRGLISDVRLSDTVRETADFTPPTAPLTSDANTTELLQFNEAACGDLTGRAIVTEAGDAQMDTGIFKYGAGSLLFDGTGDYLAYDDSSLTVGDGDFTAEGWVYWSSIAANDSVIFDARDVNLSSTGWVLNIRSTNKVIRFFTGSVGYDGVTATTVNTWHHVAVTREGTTLRIFLDGNLDATHTVTNNFTDGQVKIGQGVYSSSDWNGHMDDLRITKDVARYTANFTPPTRAAETQQT